MVNLLPHIASLGSGLSYRRHYRTDLFRDQASADFLEIVADHYFAPNRETARELDLLRDHFCLIPHGLGLSLGSAEGVDRESAIQMERLVRRLNPPYWSEHVAHTRAGSVDIGHLAPLPFTREAINTVCRNVKSMCSRIDVPLVLENITYPFAVPGSEMTEAEFLSEILMRTGCGMLLDITNLHINAINHGYDVDAFLENIPLDRIVQLHYTGGLFAGDRIVDSHSSPTPPAVWELMAKVLSEAPVRGVILERDENLPEYCELAAEMKRAREVGRAYQRWD